MTTPTPNNNSVVTTNGAKDNKKTKSQKQNLETKENHKKSQKHKITNETSVPKTEKGEHKGTGSYIIFSITYFQCHFPLPFFECQFFIAIILNATFSMPVFQCHFSQCHFPQCQFFNAISLAISFGFFFDKIDKNTKLIVNVPSRNVRHVVDDVIGIGR